MRAYQSIFKDFFIQQVFRLNDVYFDNLCNDPELATAFTLFSQYFLQFFTMPFYFKSKELSSLQDFEKLALLSPFCCKSIQSVCLPLADQEVYFQHCLTVSFSHLFMFMEIKLSLLLYYRSLIRILSTLYCLFALTYCFLS